MTTTRDFFLLLLCWAGLSLVGCRSPEFKDKEFDAGDYEFDAGSDTDDVDAGGDSAVPNCPEIFNDSLSPYRGGSERVDLKVSNFSYFHCPHCAHLAETIELLEDARPDLWKRVRFYYHHFPFSTATSFELHASAVAARNQGGDEAFWAMHDYAYEMIRNDPPKYVMPGDLADFAENELGLDMEQFEADKEDEKTLGFLQWDKEQAASLGISSTPAVFICGERVPPSFATLYELDGLISTLDSYLK